MQPIEWLELDEWPQGLEDVPAVLVQRVLPCPTLIHLPGDAPEPIFVSVLLHGDEDVGLKAVQQLWARYRGRTFPRALSIFVGNVEAATSSVRYLPHQLDFNRVWPHAEQSQCRPEQQMMRQVLERMIAGGVAASVDLHNNSGRNPHYSCVCSLEPQHLQLAALFGHRAMYFTRPLGVQTAAFSSFCPAITCECGPIGDATGVQAAVDLLERLMALGTGNLRELLPAVPKTSELYRTVGIWRVLPQATLSFDSRDASQLFLRPDLDRLNFQQLEAGLEVGLASVPLENCLEVRDEEGRIRTQEFLRRQQDGKVLTERRLIPSMLTTSVAAIRQDCVGYFLEPINLTKK